MPRVVPSQVVAFIQKVFPYLNNQTENQQINLTRDSAGELAGLLDLVNAIPDELLILDGNDFAELVCSVAAIRERIALWRERPEHANELVFLRGFRALSPVTLIRQALAKCPDQAPASGTSELSFITDADLRTNLRNDFGAVTRALSNGEWKAVTVLSGSVIEALLLWSLDRRPATDITTATAALVTCGKLTKKPDANLERWDLHEYKEVAYNLGIIEGDTYIKTDLAREYRNLIHPGRAQRLGQKCDRGTALASVAALEHVVRDLS